MVRDYLGDPRPTPARNHEQPPTVEPPVPGCSGESGIGANGSLEQCSPGRIIADPIRGIADHQLGLRSGQHQLDIRRVGAVATAGAVVSQPPDVAGPSDRLIEDIRDAVGIAQTTRPQTPQDLVKPIRLKADQIEIETTKFEITQLTAQQIEVPTPPCRQFIVSQAIGLLSSTLQPCATIPGMDLRSAAPRRRPLP